MARKRDQEDVFQPLNDSSAESEESQSLPEGPRRGWEIKLGLLALALLLGTTGYFVYRHVVSAIDTNKTAKVSGPLEPDTDNENSAGQSAISQTTVVAEPEPVSDPHVLAMAQWSGVSNLEKADQAGVRSPSGSASESVLDPPSAPMTALPSQPYADNYRGDLPPQAASSTTTTFTPVPNPNDFTAAAISPMPTEASGSPSEPVQESGYGIAAGSAGTADLNPPTSQAPTAVSAPVAPQAEPSLSPGQAVAQEMPPASQADFDAGPWKSRSEPPVAQGYSPPASLQPLQDHSVTTQDGYSQAAPPPSYSSPLPESLSPQNAPSYAPAAISRPQAKFAGLSSSRGTDETDAAEAWHQPTVIPLDGKYTTQPNDNFFTISKKVYGSGAYFEALAEYNKDQYPKADQIRIGDTVQTPPAETLESRYPQLCPKPEHRDAAKQRTTAATGRSLAGRRVYVVQEGDNLFDIARYELGARSKVAELIELNRDVLGDHINYLTPGMQLLLPETDERGPAVTQAPTGTLR